MKRQIIIIMLFITSSCAVHSQNLKSFVASGDKAMQEGNYYGAARFYEKALEIDNKIPELHYKAATAFRNDNAYRQAAKHYEYLIPDYNKIYPNAEYHLAQMLKARGNYIEAQYYFRNFKDREKNRGNDYFVKKSENEIISCYKAQKMKMNPGNEEIIQKSDSINTIYAEMCADGFADSLYYFTSVMPRDSLKKVFAAKIFRLEYQNDRLYKKKMDSLINQAGFNVANPFFDPENKTLYFTLSDKYSPTNIYKSELQNGKWTNPKKLPAEVNKDNYSSTHPVFVNTDSVDYLMYASDRPSGEGRYDIYYNIFYQSGEISRAFNVGRRSTDDSKFSFLVDTASVFNTMGNEITPFYDKSSNMLYFSSDWYHGMGEFDVFRMKFNFNFPDTTTLENMGYPVNSPQNDLYYRIDKSGKEAVLTSNRDGAKAYSHLSCCNDIFSYYLPQKVDSADKILKKEKKIKQLSFKAEKLIPVKLFFHNDRPDPGSWDTTTNVSYDESLKDYMQRKSEYITRFSAGLSDKEKQIAKDSVKDFFKNKVLNEYLELNRFFFLLEELLAEEQTVIMTIKGYTSPLNTPEYNLNLAKRRIYSFINYLHNYNKGSLSKYIDQGLLKINTVPFGETQVKKDISDNPDDRRNSVYNPAAARERKIEIIALKVAK